MTVGKREFLTALGTAFLTIGAGCSADATKEDIMSELENATQLENENGTNYYRTVDSEAGIVIYHSEYIEQGFEIIPIEETDLQ